MVKNRSRAERQQEKHFQQMAAGGGAVGAGTSSLAVVARAQPTIMDKVRGYFWRLPPSLSFYSPT
jgi:hypothetical protein